VEWGIFLALTAVTVTSALAVIIHRNPIYSAVALVVTLLGLGGYYILLQAEFVTPICLDESILSPRHARQALEMGACRVINIKAGRVGGLSQALAIHDLCHAQGVPVWCGGMLETGVGRAANLALASLPGFSLPGDISASERYYVEDITHQRFTLNPDSTITVPDAPGLGVIVDTQAVERVTLKKMRLDLKRET